MSRVLTNGADAVTTGFISEPMGMAGIAIDGNDVYAVTNAGMWTGPKVSDQVDFTLHVDAPQVTPSELVAHNGFLYWGTWGNLWDESGSVPGRVKRVPVEGGPEQILYESREAPEGRVAYLAVRDGAIYFGDFDRGRVFRRSLMAAPLTPD